MVQTKIQTKYCIKAEDVELLPENKRTWWLLNLTDKSVDNGFVKLIEDGQRIPCTSLVSVTLDLQDDCEYKLGTGNWDTIGSNGKHVSQTTYLYLKNGEAHYCARASDLPSKSLGGDVNGTSGTYNPLGKAKSVAIDITEKATYTAGIKTPPGADQVFTPEETRICLKLMQFVSPDYTCVNEFVSRDGSGIDECANCMNSRKIYYHGDYENEVN